MTRGGTRESIFNLRTKIEKYLYVNKNIYLCFIDYEKAVDRVNHTKLIQTVQSLPLDMKDIKVVKTII